MTIAGELRAIGTQARVVRKRKPWEEIAKAESYLPYVKNVPRTILTLAATMACPAAGIDGF